MELALEVGYWRGKAMVGVPGASSLLGTLNIFLMMNSFCFPWLGPFNFPIVPPLTETALSKSSS
jgi:hypothetical protein